MSSVAVAVVLWLLLSRRQEIAGLEFNLREHQRVEAALRESQALLDRTARMGAIGGWTYDPTTTQMRWTDETCRLLAYKLDHQPTLSGFRAHIEPAGQVQLDQALGQPLAPGQQWNLELPLRDTRGERLWVHVRAETEPGPQGLLQVVGTMQDVTARRAMKAEIQRGAALLRGAIEAIDEAFVLFDPQDRLVLCNEKYLRLYATSRDLLVPGNTFEHILREGVRRGQYPAAVGREEEWVAARLRAHREASGSGVQRLDDGRVVRIVERLMPDGHRVGFRVDITDLVHATEAAESADRAKGEFIATISHELRTPLQAILGFSDLGRHFAREHVQYGPMFEDIHAGGTRMLRLVNGLLDVSKLDGTHGSLELRPGDLGPLLREVLRELAPLAAQRQLRLQLPEPLPPLPADVDSFRVQQVLRNVLANALRFSPESSEVQIDMQAPPGHGVSLRVRDFGPGIPPDELETVFEPFLQSSRTRNGAGGTGLGLAICRRIMRAHGGLIVARVPASGPGTEMLMEWPAPADGAEPARPRTSLRALRQARRPASDELDTPLPPNTQPSAHPSANEDAPCATAS